MMKNRLKNHLKLSRNLIKMEKKSSIDKKIRKKIEKWVMIDLTYEKNVEIPPNWEKFDGSLWKLDEKFNVMDKSWRQSVENHKKCSTFWYKWVK